MDDVKTPKGADDALKEGVPLRIVQGDEADRLVNQAAGPSRTPSQVGVDTQAALVAAAERYSDTSNADRLATHCAEQARYCKETGWLVWDERRWTLDNRDRIWVLAQEVARKLVAEALLEPDDKLREAVVRAAKRSLQEPRLRAMVTLASSHSTLRVTEDQLDQDRAVINLLNGTLNLRTGELRRHYLDGLITKLAPVNYEPDATCPVWDVFADRIMNCNESLQDFLQRLAGSCLSGEIREHGFTFFYGLGANGKGTVVRVFQRILGDYAKTADINTFLEQGGSQGGSHHQEDVVRLKGARFVAAEEASPGRRLNIGRIKTLTGGDQIPARTAYGRHSVEFLPEFTLVLAVNNRPLVPASDHGTWRRISLLPFESTITKEEMLQDPDFEKRLRAEDEGILAWMVRGCIEWRKSGLGDSEAVQIATSEYRMESDPVERFLEERCVRGPEHSVLTSQLREVYMAWCEENGEDSMSSQAFGRRLTERGIGRSRGTGNVQNRTGVSLAKLPSYRK